MVIKTERAHQRLSQNLPEQPQLRALEIFVLFLQDQHYKPEGRLRHSNKHE